MSADTGRDSRQNSRRIGSLDAVCHAPSTTSLVSMRPSRASC